MLPAVHPPAGLAARRPLELKLKAGWRYDAGRRLFVGGAGRTCEPSGLPEGSRIVYKVPRLASADPKRLSKPERDLQRHLQVLLPEKRSASDYLAAVRGWPCVERVEVGPEVSLPADR